MSRAALAGLVVAMAVFDGNATPPTAARLRVVRDGGVVAWSAPVVAGERFTLSFEHSSEHCRWTQRYEVDATGRLHQRGSAFPCYGAGMPVASSDGSPVTWSADGLEVATPLDLDRVPMLNARAARIVLSHRGRAVEIGDLVPDLAVFVVEVR